MTYKPKFPQCPYKTSDNKCTHKHIDMKKSKKKRFCAYKIPERCPMYEDWLELNKMAENSPEGL